MIAQEAQKKETALSNSSKAKNHNPAEEDPATAAQTPAEAAEYLADLLEGAKVVASKNGMVFLAYLIQVAVEEARIQAASPDNTHY